MPPWKVGILASQTGVTAATERTLLAAALLAIEEINAAGGVDGREIVPAIYDPGGKPEHCAAQCKQLVAHDRANIIFGCYTSSQRKAVLPVIHAHDALLCYPTMYEGFEYSDNIFYAGAAPNQNNLPLAEYMMKQCGHRFCIVGSDYLFPREASRIFKEAVGQRGGKVLSEVYLPMNASGEHIKPVVETILQLRPDAIFCALVGDSVIPFYQGLHRARRGAAGITVGSLNTSEADLVSIGPEASHGHLLSMPYFSSVETAANRAFVSLYHRHFGASSSITSCSEAVYFQVHLVARALAATGADDRRLLLDALRGAEFDAPQGRIRVDPDNNHTYLWPRIGRIENGAIRVVESGSEPVKPDPYLVHPSPVTGESGVRDDVTA